MRILRIFFSTPSEEILSSRLITLRRVIDTRKYGYFSDDNNTRERARERVNSNLTLRGRRCSRSAVYRAAHNENGGLVQNWIFCTFFLNSFRMVFNSKSPSENCRGKT